MCTIYFTFRYVYPKCRTSSMQKLQNSLNRQKNYSGKLVPMNKEQESSGITALETDNKDTINHTDYHQFDIDDINFDLDDDYDGSEEEKDLIDDSIQSIKVEEQKRQTSIPGNRLKISKNMKTDNPKLAPQRPFSHGSFSVMAAEINSKSKPVEDPSFRIITEKQLDQLIQLFKEYEIRRQRNDKNLLTMKEMADLVGIKKEHMSRLFQEFMEDSFLSRRRLSIQYSKNIRRAPMTSKNQMRIEYLKQIVENNCMMSISQMAKVMCNIKALVDLSKPDRPASGPIVKKLLKKLGYIKTKIRKVPPTSNSPECIAMRKIYCDYYRKMASQGHEFNFFGMTDFHFLMYRNQGWSIQGQLPQINSNDPNKIVSLQCVIATSGMLAKTLKCGTFNKNQLTQFLLKFVENSKSSVKTKCLAMDSSMMKYKDDIELIIKGFDNPFQVIYMPPESPLINPLENIFRKLKNQIMVKKFTNNKDLYIFLNEQLKNKYEGQTLARFYQQANVYVNLGIRKKQM